MAPTAAANPPERSATFEFTETNPDFFAGTGQGCGFPVVRNWDVTLATVTYFDANGNPIRVVFRYRFVGPTHPDEPRQKAASVANTAKATNTNGATNEKT